MVLMKSFDLWAALRARGSTEAKTALADFKDNNESY
jgi:hypothetical protein